MKKVSLILTLLVLFVFSSLTVFAADGDVRVRKVGGTKVSYNHWLTYMDTRCGMNTQSHYGAKASSKLNNMNLSWKAYGKFSGKVIDSNSFGYKNVSTISDSSKRNLVIDRSTATFKFTKNGSFWNPTSNVYHCISLKNAKANFALDNNVNREISEESNIEDDIRVINDLRSLYLKNKQAQVNKYNRYQNDEEIVKSIVKELFEEDYGETLEEYTFKNGKKVSLEDFNIQKLNFGNNKELIADGVKINNPEKSNSVIIELKMPDTVYQNGNEYNLSGYVIFVDDKDEKIDYGISGDLINK